ncbi:MAG: hypothetical protein DRP87_05725 [Spirochaetes bacterium]|nr:MAG: hypothetical protein DRP87_05725 [Spirochaetota bacterium]
MFSVVGIGNPLMDLIMRTDYESFKEFNAEPGTMNLVDSGIVKKILDKISDETILPGGSCANTLRGFSWLCGKNGPLGIPAYIGAVGDDKEGKNLSTMFNSLGVKPFLAKKRAATGVSAILVTPDHERTMFTYLGASRELSKLDIDFKVVHNTRCLHIAGYMWDTENQKEAARSCIVEAKDRGIIVSFDLADPFVVHRYGEELCSWLPGKVDILFGNREELSVMTGQSIDEKIIDSISGFANIVVMKTGEEGCIIKKGNEKEIKVSGEKVSAVDTTGAGDSFAAGFLYAFLSGHELIKCGKLANLIASRIVTVEGCNYDKIDREEILRS